MDGWCQMSMSQISWGFNGGSPIAGWLWMVYILMFNDVYIGQSSKNRWFTEFYCSPILGNLRKAPHHITESPNSVPDRRDHACSNGGTPSARSSVCLRIGGTRVPPFFPLDDHHFPYRKWSKIWLFLWRTSPIFRETDDKTISWKVWSDPSSWFLSILKQGHSSHWHHHHLRYARWK